MQLSAGLFEDQGKKKAVFTKQFWTKLLSRKPPLQSTNKMVTLGILFDKDVNEEGAWSQGRAGKIAGGWV